MYTRQVEIVDTQLTGTEKFDKGVIVRFNYKGEPFRVGYEVMTYKKDEKSGKVTDIERQLIATLDEATKVIDKWIADTQEKYGVRHGFERCILPDSNFYNVCFFINGTRHVCLIKEACL